MTTPPIILGVEQRSCAIDGCPRPARQGRRRCSACDHAIARYGDPHKRSDRKGKAQRSIDRLVKVEQEECLLWPHHLGTDGYGYVRWGGVNRGAHVVICLLRHGPAPAPGMEVAHSCGNRQCVNHRHLRWATRAENMADAIGHGTTNRGERAAGSRLTAELVRQLRAEYSSGRTTFRELADRLGVGETTIQNAIRRITWAWLDDEGEATCSPQ